MANSWLLFALLSAAAAVHLPEQDEFHFKSWMSQYTKVYSPQEYYERLQIFTDNKRMIDKHNEGNHSFTMRLNQFSDMTFSEFRKSYLLSEPQNCSATKGNYLSSNAPLPDSIDWRKKGNYLTPVKNQVTVGTFRMITDRSEEEDRTVWQLLDFFNNGLSGVCGCHWNWEARTTVTFAIFSSITKSEQQLVDCAQDFNNHGCKGGLPSQAFEYILYNKGLMTETDYPYKAIEGQCRYSSKLAAAFVKDVVNITAYDEMGMVDAIATHNPVSFAFDVTADFMSYHQGVYTSTQCHSTTDMVNHAVLAVGYGQANGTPYWIVKNSWGSSWGMDGYFLIERGKNMCGLAACSSFPVV